MESIVKSLEFLNKSGFLKGVVKNNIISDIRFLPLGTTLLDNIRSEWHKSNEEYNSYKAIGVEDEMIDGSDRFAFVREQALRENLLHAKENFQQDLPLIIKSENTYSGGDCEGDGKNFKINVPRGTILSTNYFFTPSVALEKFYHIQRERKICWMKYSSNPSRYYLSDMVTEERGAHKLQSLKIKSKIGEDDLDVEKIHFVPIAAMGLKNEVDFMLNDQRLGRNVVPVLIRSEVKLETAACALLLDSIESRDSTLALNRKLAPYQCGIFCYFEDKNSTSDLADLSNHISNIIRKVGISALNLQKCHSDNWKSISRELGQMDGIGVPYCIILESETLRTGLMKLRSRDTTLSETIHITDVSNYLQKIFNC